MKTIENALKILETLVSSHENMQVIKISEKCGINKTSTYKILNDFVKYGLVEKTHNNSRYGLGHKFLNIKNDIIKKSDLRRIARPFMEELGMKCGQTINLMMLIGNTGHYLDIYTPDGVDTLDKVGESDCLYSTALGKAILANLPKEVVIEIINEVGLKPLAKKTITNMNNMFKELVLTKERGFSVEDEESKNGVRCVAAPIFTSYGEVKAAISISGLTHKVTISRLLEYSSFVIEAAHKISELL